MCVFFFSNKLRFFQVLFFAINYEGELLEIKSALEKKQFPQQETINSPSQQNYSQIGSTHAGLTQVSSKKFFPRVLCTSHQSETEVGKWKRSFRDDCDKIWVRQISGGQMGHNTNSLRRTRRVYSRCSREAGLIKGTISGSFSSNQKHEKRSFACFGVERVRIAIFPGVAEPRRQSITIHSQR